jgi:hypothetical protein
MRKTIGFILTAGLVVAGGCSDHHPDLWFDAGSNSKASDAGLSGDANVNEAGDIGAGESAADDTAVRDTAADDMVMALDATTDGSVLPDLAGDAAPDSSKSADSSTDDAQRGD